MTYTHTLIIIINSQSKDQSRWLSYISSWIYCILPTSEERTPPHHTTPHCKHNNITTLNTIINSAHTAHYIKTKCNISHMLCICVICMYVFLSYSGFNGAACQARGPVGRGEHQGTRLPLADHPTWMSVAHTRKKKETGRRR